MRQSSGIFNTTEWNRARYLLLPQRFRNLFLANSGCCAARSIHMDNFQLERLRHRPKCLPLALSVKSRSTVENFFRCLFPLQSNASTLKLASNIALAKMADLENTSKKTDLSLDDEDETLAVYLACCMGTSSTNCILRFGFCVEQCSAGGSCKLLRWLDYGTPLACQMACQVAHANMGVNMRQSNLEQRLNGGVLINFFQLFVYRSMRVTLLLEFMHHCVHVTFKQQPKLC